MDWKSAQNAPGQAEPVCYRMACWNCEWFRRSVLGGLLIDGAKQRAWWCVLMDERREPCKINDAEGQQLTAKFVPEWERKQRQATETFNPRPLNPQTSGARLQPSLPVPSIPGKPQLASASNQKPESTLPNLPRAATVRQGRSAKKRIAPG
jgi:hypothetical protein